MYTPSPNPSKEELYSLLIQYRKKLFQTILQEHQISQTFPSNPSKILTKTQERQKIISDMQKISFLLIDFI